MAVIYPLNNFAHTHTLHYFLISFSLTLIDPSAQADTYPSSNVSLGTSHMWPHPGSASTYRTGQEIHALTTQLNKYPVIRHIMATHQQQHSQQQAQAQNQILHTNSSNQQVNGHFIPLVTRGHLEGSVVNRGTQQSYGH